MSGKRDSNSRPPAWETFYKIHKLFIFNDLHLQNIKG